MSLQLDTLCAAWLGLVWRRQWTSVVAGATDRDAVFDPMAGPRLTLSSDEARLLSSSTVLYSFVFVFALVHVLIIISGPIS